MVDITKVYLWTVLEFIGFTAVLITLGSQGSKVKGFAVVRALYTGADGRLSASKLQCCWWTLVVGVGYLAILNCRHLVGVAKPDYMPTIPITLMWAMGLSLGTSVIAKGITVSQLNSGAVAKPADESAPTGDLIQDDSGRMDLSKVQLLFWNFVALGVFAFKMHSALKNATSAAPAELPEIDQALVVLMGLAKGTYLGKKLISSTSPVLTGLEPASAMVGSIVKVQGSNFRTPDNAVPSLTIDGIPVEFSANATDGEIAFIVPNRHPAGQDWTKPAHSVSVRVISTGQTSANSLNLEIRPAIAVVLPAPEPVVISTPTAAPQPEPISVPAAPTPTPQPVPTVVVPTPILEQAPLRNFANDVRPGSGS